MTGGAPFPNGVPAVLTDRALKTEEVERLFREVERNGEASTTQELAR